MKMRALLKVKTPGSREFEVVNSAPHDGTIQSITVALEYLAKQRDGWRAAAAFPANSTWTASL